MNSNDVYNSERTYSGILEKLRTDLNNLKDLKDRIESRKTYVEIEEKKNVLPLNSDITRFKLNDSKNQKFNQPLYMKIIKNGADTEQLRDFKEKFISCTDEFFDSLSKMIDELKKQNYDESFLKMCNLLIRKKTNLYNHWKSFEKNIEKYLDPDIQNTYKKIRELCSKSITELLESFPYDYCSKNDSKEISKIVSIFMQYLEQIGVSNLVLESGDEMDFDAYDVNVGSEKFETSDQTKYEKIHSINRYAYVFYDDTSDQKISLFLKGDAYVYKVV